MKHVLPAAVALAAAFPCLGQDALTTDGDKYTVLLENACVRVLEYRDLPGQKTHQHQHPPFVLYALAPFQRLIHLPDGKVIKRVFKAGEVLWSPAQTHIGENTGSTPTHAILVESKQSGALLAQCAGPTGRPDTVPMPDGKQVIAPPSTARP